MAGLKVLSKIFFAIVLFSVFHFSSYGVQAQSKWTKLEYYFNVGSLPPPYHYSYTITINSDGKGELVYIGGYESTDKNTNKYFFELGNKKIKKLNKAIKESNVLNLDIDTRPGEEIPDGGSSESLQIFGFNKGNDESESVLLKSVPPYPELKYEALLDKLYSVIRKSVPEDIWNNVKKY
jgi:hypothetical protein